MDKVATPEHSTNLQEDIKGDAGQSVFGRHSVYGTRITSMVAGVEVCGPVQTGE